MAIDQHYIPAFSIEEVLLDKDTGAPLSGGIVTFERDSQRGTFKSVYQITGTSPNYTFIALPNPMILSSIGTFEDTLGNPVVPYFLPYDANFMPDYYFVKVESSGLVPQFTREAVPFIPDAGGTDGASGSLENEVSNPQFAEVFFTTPGPYTYNFNAASSQVVHLGPDWDLVVSSPAVGSVTVNQITPTGALNIPGNPGTLLNITSAGLSSLHLRQRIYGSPNLWGSGILASTFLAKTYAGGSSLLKLWYQQSGQSPITINSATLVGSSGYTSFPTSTSIAASASAEFFPDSYIDLYFDIPLSTEIDISNVMVTPTGSTVVSNLQYSQESQNRQIDHLFHYYKPLLEYKPIPSYLVGWDFPLNPAQFGITSFSTTPIYVWDQTIMGSTVNTINVGRVAFSGAIICTTTVDDEAFYMLQYIPKEVGFSATLTRLAINLLTYQLIHTGVVAQVYLYICGTAGTIPTLPLTIGTVAASGDFTLTAANWTEVPRPNGQSNTFTLGAIGAPIDFPSVGWSGTPFAGQTTNPNMAIVVTFKVPLSGTQVVINSCSLVAGDIPTRPAPQTPDEVLRECQYYYRKSFLPGVTPADNVGSNTGESYSIQVAGASAAVFGPIVRFDYPLRTSPTGLVTLYNPRPASTAGQITNLTTGTDWSGCSATNISATGFVTTGTTPGGSAAVNGAAVHWTADARLGII